MSIGLTSLALINGKPTILVFDFGYIFTKIGFAGESSPHTIVRSEIKCRKTRNFVPVFEFKDEQELICKLIDFIHFLFFKKLLVNAKESRILIVENILGSYKIKKTLAKVFFQQYEVWSVLFVPSAVVSLMPLGAPTGLVIDLGYKEVIIVPVVEGVAILNATQAVPCGALAIHKSLEKLLEHTVCKQNGKEEVLSSSGIQLTDNILEDIKVRCCFVTTLNRIEAYLPDGSEGTPKTVPSSPPSIDYSMGAGAVVVVPGAVREMASEVVFKPEADGLDLGTAVLRAIIKSPIDTRAPLAQNLVVCGGGAALTGMRSRLLAQVRSLAKTNKFADSTVAKLKFAMHNLPTQFNSVAWLGGSMFGCTEAVTVRSQTFKEFLANGGIVPDWSLYDDPSAEAHVKRSNA